MINVPVSEIFGHRDIKGVVAVSPSTMVSEAVATMASNGIGAVVVMHDDDRVAGIFTERDVMRRVVSPCSPTRPRTRGVREC